MARKKSAEQTMDLDLIPIMNLSGQLIALLLITTTFVGYAVINVNAPRFNVTQQTPVVPEKPPLNLTVLVTDQGFTVSVKGQNLGTEGGGVDASAAAGPTIPKKRVGGKMEYDLETLSRKVREIKDDDNEDESQVNIGAEKTITYETIVQVMDTTREDEKGELFPNVVLLGGVI